VAYYNAFLSENFVVVDGACRSWLNSPDIGGLRSGVLSTEEAAILSQTLHYGQYEALSNYESVQCPDGGAWTLVDDTHDLVCRCGICGSGSEPEEFREAFAAAAQLELDLSQKGEWAWGPTRVLPIVSSDNSFYLPWTLEVALADVAFDTAEQSFAPDEGVLIDDPEQLALLWVLRQQNIDRGAGMQMFVRDDEGNGFALFVRDQPPRAVMDALSVDIHG
jgi:hypothetical protein